MEKTGKEVMECSRSFAESETLEVADHTFWVSVISGKGWAVPQFPNISIPQKAHCNWNHWVRSSSLGLSVHRWKPVCYRASLPPSWFRNIFPNATLLAAKEKHLCDRDEGAWRKPVIPTYCSAESKVSED